MRGVYCYVMVSFSMCVVVLIYYILNLIVQEGLKVIDDSVIKIQETMKYLKGLESRMCRFDECAKIVSMKRTKGLRLDVCTR